MSVKSVVEQLKNSVVSITVYSPDGSAGSQASGMILSEDGYILTNDHIYKDIPNAKFMITLYNGEIARMPPPLSRETAAATLPF